MPGPSSISTPLIQPVGPFVTVQLLPEDAPSSTLVVIKPADLTQKAVVLAIGQGIHDLEIGSTVLCRPMQGQLIGDEGQMLLPSSAILATFSPED